jgi:hypothetical protein
MYMSQRTIKENDFWIIIREQLLMILKLKNNTKFSFNTVLKFKKD